jgi:trimethylamine---corrinoid protein Co-methyltransferase
MTESGVTFDPAQFVLDNEYARLIKYAVRGVEVNDQTLLVDDIIAVGTHKDYLSLDSTLARMREPSTSQLLDRRVREDWEADGGREVNVKARATALEIIESHQPAPVDPDALAQVRAIVDGADRERGG